MGCNRNGPDINTTTVGGRGGGLGGCVNRLSLPRHGGPEGGGGVWEMDIRDPPWAQANFRPPLLFGMMLNWGLEVQSFNLTTEQSAAAFALAQRLAVQPPPSATQTPMATDGGQEYTEAGEQTPDKSQKLRYDALTIKKC